MISLQRLQPDGGVGPCHLGSGALGQRQRPSGVAVPRRRFPPARRQPLLAELADRFQHPIARGTALIAFVDDEALGDEGGEKIERVRDPWLLHSPHPLGGLEREAAGKDGEELE